MKTLTVVTSSKRMTADFLTSELLAVTFKAPRSSSAFIPAPEEGRPCKPPPAHCCFGLAGLWVWITGHLPACVLRSPSLHVGPGADTTPRGLQRPCSVRWQKHSQVGHRHRGESSLASPLYSETKRKDPSPLSVRFSFVKPR